jgi:hypothetical protein
MNDRPLTRAQVEDRLAGLGRLLYAELFPPGLREAYRHFRDKVRTVQITTDEPWIPWELIRPYDDSDPDRDRVIDDDYLCMRFQLTRWLAGFAGGAGKIRAHRLACIEVTSPPGNVVLRATGDDRRALAEVAAAHGAELHAPVQPTVEDVLDLMDAGSVGVWHFAAHGQMQPAHANEAAVLLAGGSELRPQDINGPRQTHLSRDRPLVFLNACQMGRQGWALTGLGGWAAALVGRCRCGAFVGPLWDINDDLAGRFARTFYRALGASKSFAQAGLEARQELRALAPHDPTFLAYSLYAHPNGRVAFGAA